MPRRTRLDGPGVPVHVTDRGDLGRALFVTDDDKAFVVSRAARIFAEEGISCLAFAVMTNHLHFLLVPGEAPLARAMLRLKVSLVRRHRSLQGERGHVFQGRYHTNCLVRRRRDGRTDEAALPAVLRYILLNPHEAGITRSLEDLLLWPWTSLPDLIGARTPVLTDVAAALDALGGDRESSRNWIVRTLAARIRGDESGDEPVHVVLPPRAVSDARMREGQRAATGDAAARALADPALLPFQTAEGARRVRRAALEALGWSTGDVVAAACRHFGADEQRVRLGVRTAAETAARSVAIAIGCDLVGVRLSEMAAATGIGTAAAVVARTRGRQRIRESAIDVEALLAPGREG